MGTVGSGAGRRPTGGWLHALCALTVVALPCLGCSAAKPRACTLVGCADGLTIQLGAHGRHVAHVRVCVAAGCQTPDVQRLVGSTTGDFVTAAMTNDERHAGAHVLVTIDLYDRGGNVISEQKGTFAVRELEPNGPGCGTCFQVDLGLDSAYRLHEVVHS